MDIDSNFPDRPLGDDANVRAPAYYVLQATHACRHCQRATPVFALALPPDHESTEADIELEEDGDSLGLSPTAFHDWLFSPAQWQRIAGPALISQVGMVAASVAHTLNQTAPTLRPDPDRQGQWTNFCDHCQRAVWEGDLYPTVGQAFCPKDDAAAAHMTVHVVNAPFAAYATMIWSDSYRNKWPLFKRLGVQCSEP
ncbi:hypothetical protein [Achromobacter spanius]|uniref:hypothetical protein n=1 Tax=Achromobacter spanius TaxID=217203 RepID=UPI003F68E0D2